MKRMQGVPLVMVALVFLALYYTVAIALTKDRSHSMMGLDNEISVQARQLNNMTNNQTLGSQFPPDLFTLEQKRMGAILLHILGILYMLIGLALVCDEFFVPSLEVIVEILKIPTDVAGATFMAAGGSAPEFFTSLFGIFFARNSIGFGTIVGSAVFNILFVIGLCGLLAKNALRLTWWPLFRDTFFYAVALSTLIGFFQGGEITWYESFVLFLLYVLYVLFMFINGRTEKLVRKFISKLRKFCSCKKCKKRVEQRPVNTTNQEQLHVDPFEESQSQVIAIGSENETDRLPELTPKPSLGKLTPMKNSMNLNLTQKDSMLNEQQKHQLSISPAFSKGQRRVSNDSGFQSPSDTVVSQSHLYQNPPPVPSAFYSQSTAPEPPRPPSQFKDIRRKSSQAILKKIDSGLGSLGNSSDSSSRPDIPIIQVEPAVSDASMSEVAQTSEQENEEPDLDEEGIVHIKPPKTWCKRMQYVLFFPLILLLFFTLPNIRKPKWKWWFPYVFVGSIVWIGVFSYFMVWWATEFGETAMIPPSVMGMTILAAGTSIPDLITSVIVARKGYGDMAVSSSIGSNMFDITVGLPIPWLLFSAVNSGQGIQVFSMGLFCSVILLFGMLLVTVTGIAIFRWKLGKLLGLVFLVMYVIFITFGVLLELVLVCSIS